MILLEKIRNHHIILATQSPRRHLLMKEAGFNFEIIVPEGIEEIYPSEIKAEQIPIFLADLKASWFSGRLKPNDIVITADTIVILNHHILEKPQSRQHAIDMLKLLSGNTHTVVTGVCFLSHYNKKTFKDTTKVKFREFSNSEIEYYVDTYKPYDKAGSYGAQEWIGYVGIENITGSYFNVMGLPIHKVYSELERFIGL